MTTLVLASELAKHVNGRLVGPDRAIAGVRSIDDPADGHLCFVGSESLISQALLMCESVILVSSLPNKQSFASFILVDNPRLAFALSLSLMYLDDLPFTIHPSALVSPTAEIRQRVSIAPFCVVEDGCVIADGVRIDSGTVIKRNTVIGENTTIGANCTIGGIGYGFEPNESNTPIRIPHVGNVVIGENVEIGSNVVIARATIGSTTIGNDSKIDDQVFIAHNVKIGNRCYVIAGAELSGSVVVGDDCWIAPRVSIREKLTIGANATIGIGAVVISDVPTGAIVAGNPARPLPKPS